MLTISELSKVYNKDYFSEGVGSFEIKENANSKKKGCNIGLESVKFDNCGEYLTITPAWKGNAGQYLVNGYKYVRYRKDCDCTALIKKGDKLYLFLIEMKSRICGVFDDAIYKYAGVYYRTKSCLDDFANHQASNFEEVALIIYAPDAPSGPETNKTKNAEMFDQKKAMIKTPEEVKRISFLKKYKARLLDKTLTYLDGSDFGVDDLPILPKYKMNHLKTILWPVSYPTGAVDLEDVIKLL